MGEEKKPSAVESLSVADNAAGSNLAGARNSAESEVRTAALRTYLRPPRHEYTKRPPSIESNLGLCWKGEESWGSCKVKSSFGPVILDINCLASENVVAGQDSGL